MARLIPGTEQYTKVFGAQLEVPQFVSLMPEYYSLTQAWADPSIAADLGVDDEALLNSKLSKDVQMGAQRMSWSMSVPGLAANVPTVMLAGRREIAFSAAIESSLPAKRVAQLFDPSKRPPGARGLVGVGIGVAIAAAGVAIPIVGQVAGFVIAFG